MANRSFIDKSYTMVKREVRLYFAVEVDEGRDGITLQKWNYPQMGQTAAPARTYTAAPTTPAGQGWALQYQTGAEGVRSITRTAAGMWTVKLQDNYQRVLHVGYNGQLAGGLSLILGVGIDSTLTDMDATDGSEIGLALLASTGAVGDPASGEIALISLILADATEP